MGRGPAVRVALVVGGLVLCGIMLRLLGEILKPVLPASLMRDVSAGWEMLYGVISPAVPAMFAVGILAAVSWAVVGWLRRY